MLRLAVQTCELGLCNAPTSSQKKQEHTDVGVMNVQKEHDTTNLPTVACLHGLGQLVCLVGGVQQQQVVKVAFVAEAIA